MSTEETSTGDLFEVDKRLALKPVADFNAYLIAAFGAGPCTCVRCVAGSGEQSGYEYPHTFTFEGLPAHRRFASTAASDVLQMLKKAWLSYTKAELPGSGDLDLPTIKAFVEGSLHTRLLALLTTSGVVKDVDGQWRLQALAG